MVQSALERIKDIQRETWKSESDVERRATESARAEERPKKESSSLRLRGANHGDPRLRPPSTCDGYLGSVQGERWKHLGQRRSVAERQQCGTASPPPPGLETGNGLGARTQASRKKGKALTVLLFSERNARLTNRRKECQGYCQGRLLCFPGGVTGRRSCITGPLS